MAIPELPLKTRLFKPGRTITIFATSPEGTEEFSSRVLEVTSEFLRVTGPFEEERLILFPLWKQVRVAWPDECDEEGRMPMIVTQVVGFEGGPTPVLHLSATESFFTWKERRRFLRYSAIFPVFFSVVGEEDSERRKMSVDICEGGIRLSEFSPGEVRMGQEVKLELYLPGRKQTAKAQGKIVYIRQMGEECGVGIKFISIEESSEKILLEYIMNLEELSRDRISQD